MFRKKFLGMVLLAGMLISQSVPPAHAATYCDHAQFVSDLTAPDGAAFAPGTAFTKTWRLMNIGTCTWTTSYNIVWVGGDSIGAPLSVNLPVDVPPGQMVDVSVNLTAPLTGGHYKGLFKISNATGIQFGIGDSASDPFWVDINVIEVNAVIYDFVANAPYAQWKSGAGAVPFPGTSGDSRGFAYQVNNPHLEDDSFDSMPGLLTVPQNKFNGYIQATYPEFQIQQGDRLQTLVNCEFGAKSCYVTFRIDYLTSAGAQKTLWSWKEAYDKRFYRADIDLSPLAGQKVRFVFMLLSSGFASGDRAIWGSPRIVRTGTVQPPAPPPTLTPLPPLPASATPLGQPPPTIQPSGCDRAAFVSDVTVQDGTVFAPGAAFTKTWRLKNVGYCTWTTSYKLIYYSGEQMSAPTSVNLPWGAAYGQTVDITVNMVAPATAGKYRGFWILSNTSGQFFGIGANASNPIWVEINVAGESPVGADYDFTSNVCSAEWKSGAGILPCPGTDGNTSGFVLRLDAPKLEDGSTGAPGLLTSPQNRYNGYIQGFYPTFTVQPGDKFQTTVGCEFGAACYVTFRLDYMTASGYIGTFWQWREQNEGKYYSANIDLSPLAGRSVRFILTILATGYATNDRAVWSAPRIVRAGGAPPTITPVPPTDNWLTYTNSTYGFQFKYPPGSERFFETNNSILIRMPITPGTNLMEKYLQMSVNENVNPCQSSLSDTSRPGSPTETVVFNGIPFFKQIGGDAGAGNFHEWVGYSTLKNNACISMDFVLHSLAAGAFEPPVPEFDKAAESAVFAQVMSTFGWSPVTVTPVAPTVPPVLVPSPNIRELSMNDASNGWAIGDAYILRTGDGGATWYNVTPPGVASVRNGFFQNLNVGWVIATLSEGNVPALFRTMDGGSTWVTYYNIPFNNGYIQFLDSTHGFVMTILGAATNRQSVALYQTADGGATWVRNYINDPTVPGAGSSLPLGGHKNGMTFRDTMTGWVGGDIPTNGFVYLYKTTDSGVTWSQQPLALPAGYESAFINTTAPQFFGATDAILPVWMTLGAGQRDLYIYASHDGGMTWGRSSAFVRQGNNTDFISINNGFTWDGTGLFHFTNSAGASWSNITPNANFGDSARDMDFVSTTTGWMLDADSNGNAVLYRTTDGGATWTLLFGNPPAVTPVPQLLPDLTITQLRIELQNTSCLMPGDPMGVRLWLTNNGQAAASSFAVKVNGVEQTVDGLGIGETKTVFFSGYSNPVTATVDSAGTIAESDENNNSRSEMVPVPTPPLPCVTPTFTPGPVTLTGPYAVVRVALNDVLNIRSGAGGSQPVVGSFTPDAINVMRTGPAQTADGNEWVEVQRPDGGIGWVNSSYLTEYVTHEAFCADTRVPTLIEQLKGSINQSNGDMLASLVSPTHGIDVRLWAYQPAIHFNLNGARSAFLSTEVYNWGAGPRGEPDYGTFKDVIQPKVSEVLNAASVEIYCDNLTKVYPLANPWPYTNIRFYNLYKPASGEEFNFRTWLIGIEYVNNQPYLYGMVTIVWEP
ncbi:MAG TPA: NBR1-Ig-like domain-containing protein [Anaerolineales bacterium]